MPADIHVKNTHSSTPALNIGSGNFKVAVQTNAEKFSRQETNLIQGFLTSIGGKKYGGEVTGNSVSRLFEGTLHVQNPQDFASITLNKAEISRNKSSGLTLTIERI